MLVSGPVFESLVPPAYRLIQLRRWIANHPESLPESAEERSELSDMKIELFYLVMAIVVYSVVCQLIPFIVLGFYFQFSPIASSILKTNGVNAWWWSLFQAVSSFQNAGFGLLFDSLIQVNQLILPLAVAGGQILFGNNFFPIFLRAGLRLTEKLLTWRRNPKARHFQNILENPRRYSAFLFPAKHTWALLVVIVFFIVLQTSLMCALDNSTPAFAGLSNGYIFANAVFQSLTPRAAGITTINVAALHVESLVLMIAMMYVAAYPVAVLLRSTNEEQQKDRQDAAYQLRRLLLQDAFWVIFPWYMVCAIERFDDYAKGFSTIFETISAFGCVGVSLGTSKGPYSFSGSLSVASKLVVIVTMVVGRHRGMPDKLDTALRKLGQPRLYEVKTREMDNVV